MTGEAFKLKLLARLQCQWGSEPEVLAAVTFLHVAGINMGPVTDSAFPAPKIPPMDKAGEVLLTAVFVMFIGFIESVSVTKTYGTINK